MHAPSAGECPLRRPTPISESDPLRTLKNDESLPASGRNIHPARLRMESVTRAPTNKSRLIAGAGMLMVAGALVLDGWFSPPLPPLSTPILGAIAVLFMYLA